MKKELKFEEDYFLPNNIGDENFIINSVEEYKEIDWNILGNIPYKIKFVIPIENLSVNDAKSSIKELMNLYKEETKIDN